MQECICRAYVRISGGKYMLKSTDDASKLNVQHPYNTCVP